MWENHWIHAEYLASTKGFCRLSAPKPLVFPNWRVHGIGLSCFLSAEISTLTDDTFIYGEIAKNWLQHGVFGETYQRVPEPTLIRMPGYPLFLVLTWIVAGMEHYTAALIVQIVVDVATCFVIADLARRIASERAAKVAFGLAALCPFFGELRGGGINRNVGDLLLGTGNGCSSRGFRSAIATHEVGDLRVALASGIVLRPDGGILLIAIVGYTLVVAGRRRNRDLLTATVLLGTIALAPLVPWTIRNWNEFQVFQPLTPFNANMPSEFVPHGFQRWVRTWIADYSSVEDVWFKVSGSEVRTADLPPRAWDSEDERTRLDDLFQRYVDNGNAVSPEIDAAFKELAHERIRRHPLRYYVELPLLRAADLWLRPRTEMLPIDPHWWRLREDDPPQFWSAVALGAINLFYVVAALVALRKGQVRYAALFLAFAMLRTAFLAWMPNPEPRYALECYPALLAMAGAAFVREHVQDRKID